MDWITAGEKTYRVERATSSDVPELVRLLSDDILGAGRETTDMEPYEAAFAAIDQDSNQYLACIRDEAGDIAATMQLSLIPGLSRGGSTRLQIESVRVAASARGAGLGQAMFDWAHQYGRERGAALAQLTTDKVRDDALTFYARLGYRASHEGLKLSL